MQIHETDKSGVDFMYMEIKISCLRLIYSAVDFWKWFCSMIWIVLEFNLLTYDALCIIVRRFSATKLIWKESYLEL